MPIVETVAIKIITFLTKPALVVGGWLAGLILLFMKDKRHSRKELVYKCTSSVIAIPSTMGVDHFYNLDKWAACTVSVILSFTMWKILEKAEDRVPGLIDNQADKL
jgi:hypothetical protein